MSKPVVKYLKNYQAPPYQIHKVDLNFNLYEDKTIVTARTAITRKAEQLEPLILDGQEMKLLSIAVDGKELNDAQFKVTKDDLTIFEPPVAFTLEIVTEIHPEKNTSLEGLYKSKTMFCTQCEAEGFRKITYFLDRPDVMAKYTCTIEADQTRYPVLLSNGNMVEKGQLLNNRHWVKWEDPFHKPSYLFALVAGDLESDKSTYKTRSGKIVDLQIFVEKGNVDKCGHAMESLKKAMEWDEEVFGLEYDLDIYMIVAVSDFNMGAMENKGLNVFNSKYVLARPETATDTDYHNIEGVIAHEYFHNWTGNRVTLNSWFQLSLKEGLTVFRDQEFSSDMTSRANQRVMDVRRLKMFQFPEDSGPMAHPIRPESYIEMNNFYTATVYEKGAEVIRMIHTILGPENFRKGMDLYFQRHDGSAVTTNDFVKAMEDASGISLDHFQLWYSQAGTPKVKIEYQYFPEEQRFSITFQQTTPPTPKQDIKHPLHLPVRFALLGQDGKEIPLKQSDNDMSSQGECILNLHETQETFHFFHVPEQPVPSVFRNFSAPVKIDIDYTFEELLFLMTRDTDYFNRWDAAQKLYKKELERLVELCMQDEELQVDPNLLEAYSQLLSDHTVDKQFLSLILNLPSEIEIGEFYQIIHVDAIHKARKFLLKAVAEAHYSKWMDIYQKYSEVLSDEPLAQSISRRSIKNMALYYLSFAESEEVFKMIDHQVKIADNMTDQISALQLLTNRETSLRESALEYFYQKWSHDELVMDKWFMIQAQSERDDTLSVVKNLLENDAFNLKNPNKVRSLIGSFAHGNPSNFHKSDGSGYEFLAEMVIQLNAINPQVASRLVSAFNHWKKFDPNRQEMMKIQLNRILMVENLSSDVYEIVTKALN
jgi:aminopeptidase N